jgi:hypothetical protein
METNRKLLPERELTSADEMKSLIADMMGVMNNKYKEAPFMDHYNSIMTSLRMADEHMNKIRIKEIMPEAK